MSRCGECKLGCNEEGVLYCEEDLGYEQCIDTLQDALYAVDRPQGEWFKDDEGTFICSACGSGYKDQPTLMGKPLFEWCPLCGAKMKGAGDDDS